MFSYLTTVDVPPHSITYTPSPADISSHASVATIPSQVTTVTNNGYKSDSLDGIIDIIDMGSPPTATVTLSSLSDTSHNAL